MAAAEAWNRYCDEVVKLPDVDQARAVAALRRSLGAIGVLQEDRSVWVAYLEQAEDGML